MADQNADRQPSASRRYRVNGIATGYPVRTEDVRIPMDDGVILAATLYVPDAPDAPATPPFPALLESIPYRKDDWTLSRDWPLHGAFAAAGYVSCRLDIRGTGTSTGIADDEYTEREILDNLAVIDWLATQPWSSGAVGMFGISWGGFSALQAATRRPPALRAIIPACFSHDRYHLDVHWWGGARLLAESAIWPVEMVGENALPPDPQRFGEGWRAEWLRRLELTPQWAVESLRHQRRDAHWTHGSAVEEWRSIEAPVLALGGLNDWYRDAVEAVVANVRAPRRGIVGPWGHAWPHDGAPGPAIDGVGLMLRWWDRWLKGQQNGVEAGPPLTVFVPEPEPDGHFQVELAPAELPGRWWSIPAWPLGMLPGTPDGRTTLYLAADGRLSATVPEWSGGVTWAGGPAGPAGALTAPFTCTGSTPQGGPLDQRPDDAAALVWQGEPLAEPLLIVGTPMTVLYVAVDRPVAQVAVRLEAVATDGTVALLARGLLNLTRRDSFAEPTPAKPGAPLHVRVPLTFTAARLPAGHRLRVAISGTAFPVAWPPPEPVRLDVRFGGGRPSAIVLPAGAGWQLARAEFGQSAFDPGDAEHLPGIPGTWRTERDEIAGTTTVITETGGGHRFPERDGLTFASDERYRFSVHDGWAVARTEGSTACRVEWPGGPSVTADGELAIESSAEAFDLRVGLVVTEDGTEVFRRTWSELIPRDLC